MKSFVNYCEDKNSVSKVLVCEASLTRLLSLAKKPFAIITAYKVYDDEEKKIRRTRVQNIQKNRLLRTRLNSLGLGVHQLIGHWRECTLEDVPYAQCPPDKLVDTIERSYFVPLPEHYFGLGTGMNFEDFSELIQKLGKEFDQNAVIISDGVSTMLHFKDGGAEDIGKMSLNSIGQGYSQHILKQNVPFKFEGFEQMFGNFAREGATRSGLVLPSINEDFKVLHGVIIN